MVTVMCVKYVLKTVGSFIKCTWPVKMPSPTVLKGYSKILLGHWLTQVGTKNGF